MANTKQVKAANVLNNGFDGNFAGGDGVSLFGNNNLGAIVNHPTLAGTFSNQLQTPADLNETSLEQSLIDISAFTDERGLKIAARGMKMIIHPNQQFTAERLMESKGRTGTADNDINAIVSRGMVPQGYVINHYPISTKMEGDFDTGNVRYKARERYSFGFSDPRGMYASAGN
jgi:hypothetical protein